MLPSACVLLAANQLKITLIAQDNIAVAPFVNGKFPALR